MRDVVALVTLEMPVAEADSVAGETKKSLPPRTRLQLDDDTAAELVAAKAVAYDEEAAAVTSSRPEGDALSRAIGQAMRDIDPDEGLTPEGNVSIYALQVHLGYAVTAEERDTAQAIFEGKRGDLFDAPAQSPMEQLVDIINGLDRDNSGFWTQGGLPDLRVLSEKAGRKITTDERDEALAIINDAAAS